MKAFRILLISVFLFFIASPESVQERRLRLRKDLTPRRHDFTVMKEEGPIEIEADRLSYDKEEQLYQGHGNVTVTRGNFTLKAEHARLSAATHEMVAWGTQWSETREDVLECERLEVNLMTRAGKVHQAKLF